MGKLKFCRFDYAAFAMFMAYALCSLIVPVLLVEIADELGFTLSEGGMGAGGALQLGRSIPMVIAMSVCGLLAGRFGLRKVLMIGAWFMAAGIALAAFAQWYWMLLMVLIIAGLGEGLVEGLGTPFVGAVHEKNEPGRYINVSHGFWSVGLFVCMPLLAWLLGMKVSWRLLLGIVAGVTLIPGIMLMAGRRKRVARLEGNKDFNAAASVRAAVRILKDGKFWLFFAAMFFAGGGEFGITFWCASLLRLDYQASAFMGGVATAVFSAGMMIGRTGSGILFRQYQLPILLMVMAFSGAVLAAGFVLVNNIVLVMILLFATGLASAPFWPSCQSYCVDRLGYLDSTLLYILLSCAGIPGAGVLSAVLGKAGDLWGLRMSFLIVTGCYVILGCCIAFDYFILNGRNNMTSLKFKKK